MKIALTLLNCLLLLFPSVVLSAEINLSAAASLKEAVNEVADAFTKRTPGVKIIRNFGASGALAKQIANGAPAEIFISANKEWLDYLKDKQLLQETSISCFAFNELIFVGKSGPKINGMQDLHKLGRIAIGSPRSVPAGEYAMEAIHKSGIDTLVGKKLVMARDVRECLMYAERGEVDGAFVYKTDALQAAKYARVLFTVPHELYRRVSYPMALTSQATRKSNAVAFYNFLQSKEAKTILKRFGFGIH